jgi:hypothetical protein
LDLKLYAGFGKSIASGSCCRTEGERLASDESSRTNSKLIVIEALLLIAYFEFTRRIRNHENWIFPISSDDWEEIWRAWILNIRRQGSKSGMARREPAYRRFASRKESAQENLGEEPVSERARRRSKSVFLSSSPFAKWRPRARSASPIVSKSDTFRRRH